MKRSPLKMTTLAALCLTLGLTAGFGQEPQILDETVARVNRDVITRSAFERERRRLCAEIAERLKDKDKATIDAECDKLSKNIIPSLIDERLIAQKADELGINVEADINQYIVEICKQNNLNSISDCQSAMERQGMSMDALKSDLRGQFQRRAVIGQEVYSAIYEKITEKEKRDFYAKHQAEFTSPGEYYLSEIFIGFTAENQTQMEARAKEAVVELRSGKDFVAVVRKYSDDNRPTKANGGELKPFKDGELTPEIEKEVAKLQPGQISPVLKLRNGFQVLKLVKRVPPQVKPFDEVVNDITQRIASERAGDKVKDYIKKLRAKAYIDFSPDYKEYEAILKSDANISRQ